MTMMANGAGKRLGTGETSGFLDGLLVVELGSRVAAGACGGLLARLGATVVLVEPRAPGRKGKWRDRAAVAAGKLSIVVEAGGDGFRDALLNAADIVILSSDTSPSDLAVWEDGRHPEQIVCDITAFGHSGPLAGQAVSEPMVQALSGVADTTGRRDGGPAITGAPFLDMEAAVYAVAAILAAFRVRRVQGFGQRIDMALYDVAVNALLTFIPLQIVGRPATRNGNRHPTSAPWNAFRATDGWVLICGPTNDQWRRLCVAMGAPGLADDPLFATPTARFENVEALDATIGTWVATIDTAACIRQVGAQGIPCSSILGLDDLGSEPNLALRRMVLSATDPLSGSTVRVPGSPFRVAGEPAWEKASIPKPGADRAAVEALLSARPAHAGSGRSTGKRALEGVRVVEIGMNTVAPLAARQLGALGADVIKVEPPAGDTNRVNAPLREDGEAYVFALSNTDKRGIVLDLKQPDDLATLWRMLATADMVIENLKPGSLGRLGVGAEQVLGRFPGIIYCSVNGFGYDTAYPGRPALDTVIQAMSGAMSATVIDGLPTKAGISISDQFGGQFGLAAMLAALERRERTGKGMHLDIAMQDCSAWATHAIWNGRDEAGPSLLQTSDGYVAVESAAQAEAVFPGAHPDETRAEFVARLKVEGHKAAPVLTVGEVMAHPQTAARGLLKTVSTADGTQWLVLGPPFALLSTPAEVRSAMPRLGFAEPSIAGEFFLEEAHLPAFGKAVGA